MTEREAGSRHVAHIYFNAATGERVATLIRPGARPADADSSADVWVSAGGSVCAGLGGGSSLFQFVLDDPACTSCATSTATGMIALDWGEIETDKVIDCVRVNWTTQHADTDGDGDGIPDGVRGFGGIWSWYDGDLGGGSSASISPIAALAMHDLPGSDGSGIPATYTATVDLAGVTPSRVFEIGDTDSASDAPNFNPMGVHDDDGDGMAEFSYAFRFVQPGTCDWDGDGVPDGDPGAAAVATISLDIPPGTSVDNGDGTWSYIPDPPPAAQGITDGFDLFTDLNDDGVLEPHSTIHGGFSCDADNDGTPGDVRPFLQISAHLLGPDGGKVCCCVDLAPPLGVLNFFDIAAFIDLYNGGDPEADLAAPFGVLNFFDIVAYITSYNAGCP